MHGFINTYVAHTLCKTKFSTIAIAAVMPLIADVIISFEKVQDLDSLNKALVLQVTGRV